MEAHNKFKRYQPLLNKTSLVNDDQSSIEYIWFTRIDTAWHKMTENQRAQALSSLVLDYKIKNINLFNMDGLKELETEIQNFETLAATKNQPARFEISWDEFVKESPIPPTCTKEEFEKSLSSILQTSQKVAKEPKVKLLSFNDHVDLNASNEELKSAYDIRFNWLNDRYKELDDSRKVKRESSEDLNKFKSDRTKLHDSLAIMTTLTALDKAAVSQIWEDRLEDARYDWRQDEGIQQNYIVSIGHNIERAKETVKTIGGYPVGVFDELKYIARKIEVYQENALPKYQPMICEISWDKFITIQPNPACSKEEFEAEMKRIL